MLTVACVLSNGPKRSYNEEHVQRLHRMVKENLDQPFHFACVQDSPWLGWWAKISLFEPGRFKGRVLYLDLDVTITGRLDDLADFDASFAICRDFTTLGFNSSVMVWDAGVGDHIYTAFDESVIGRLHGDQDWIQEAIPHARVFPRRWCVSYKNSRLAGGVPKGMRVLVYHGQPKPWDLDDSHC